MSTTDNLQDAFAGESQANRKYLAFARQADKEGHAQAAKLFRAAAEAETIHALAHLRVMRQVGDTSANLQAAIDGETHEFKQMYPAMITEAVSEGNKPAEISFRNANAVEEIHAGLFSRALQDPDGLPEGDYRVCPVCGNTVEGSPPEHCPICNTPAERFYRVD